MVRGDTLGPTLGPALGEELGTPVGSALESTRAGTGFTARPGTAVPLGAVLSEPLGPAQVTLPRTGAR
jgi:hypothetical protein